MSALHGDHEAGVEDRDMFYFPEMGDLPSFDLPDDLQLELPNIATDLQFQLQDTGPAIVPTLNFADIPDNIIEDLPDITDGIIDDNSFQEAASSPPIPPPPSSSTASAPPP